MAKQETDKVHVIERKVFLDLLRASAVCAVVLLHTVTGFKDSVEMLRFPVTQKLFLSIMDLVTWCVPVFVMISGYLFLNPEREFGWKIMLTKYCRRIALALLLFGVPYAGIELVANGHGLSLTTAGEALWMVLRGKSWSHMWYLYMILFLYLVTPVIKWVLKRVPMSAVYVCLGVLLLFASLFPYINKFLQRELLPVLPDSSIYVFYYLCGYLFVKKEIAGKNAIKKVEIPGWVLPTLIVLLAGFMAASRFLPIPQVQMAYDYPFTVLLSGLVFAWAEKACARVPETCMVLSRLSFAVYLIHPLYVNIVYKFLKLTILDYPLEFSLPVFWIVFLSLSVASAWLLGKISILRKYVL